MEKLNTLEEINTFISNNPLVLLYSTSENCVICKALYPKLKEALRSYPLLSAASLNIDELPAASGAFQIFSLPCILVFAEGKEVIREARYISINILDEKLHRIYDLLFD